MFSEFTWFEKFTRVLNAIPGEEDQARFVLAVVKYGTTKEEPQLAYPLNALFESIREDIENSVGARNKNKGGRPKKQGVSEGLDQDEKPTETGGFETSENITKQGVSEGLETSQNPSLYKPKPKPMPNPKPKKSVVIKKPPTVEDVEEYARGQGITIDACRFCDYYAAQGWKLSNGNPMKDWQAAVRNWARPKKEPGGERDEYSNL